MQNICQIKAEALYFGFFLFLSLLGCQESELKGEEIIKNSIEAHGGLDTWKSIKQLSFDKETTLFLEDGSVELKTNQFQLFRFDRKLFGKIEWEQNENDIQIIYENDEIKKLVNDSLVKDDLELQKAENSFWAAFHVACKPFDLIGEHVSLKRAMDYDIDGKLFYAVDVIYAGDNEKSDKWAYIIDKETFKVKANKIVLSDHSSLVDNLTFDKTTDFIFNAHRKSFRLNEIGEKTYLRAEYFYSNYDVQK